MNPTPVSQQVPFHILTDLRAEGPHPDYAQKLMLFGQFIGVWDMDVRFFNPAGDEISHRQAEWQFSWILDGRAIQDVLKSVDQQDAAKNAPGQRGIGTTLRYYNPKLDLWRVVWFGVSSGLFVSLTGRPSATGILLEGLEDDGTLNQWSFSEITPDSFRWRGMASKDNGASWYLEEEMFARRK
ncbi:MAG: hypothetical protein U0694_19660 [Anaerolineae bacterium]